MQLPQIQWTKIQKEIPIDEFVIDVETNDGKLLIDIIIIAIAMYVWIANQNLVIPQRFFESAIIESVLKF